jgi:hypothetical protein
MLLPTPFLSLICLPLCRFCLSWNGFTTTLPLLTPSSLPPCVFPQPSPRHQLQGQDLGLWCQQGATVVARPLRHLLSSLLNGTSSEVKILVSVRCRGGISTRATSALFHDMI